MSLQPIKNNTFKLAEHAFRRHSCSVEASTKKEQLTDPKLFVNVSAKINDGDEIRVVADDYSFVAILFVVWTRGHDVKTVLTSYTEVGDTEPADMPDDIYKIVLKGVKKFCIVDTRDGNHLIEGLPDKKTAQNELDDYLKALNR